MKRMTLFIVLALALVASGAMTYSASDIVDPAQMPYIGSGNTTYDPLYLLLNEMEGRLEGTGAIGYLTFTPTDTEPGTTAGMAYFDTSETTVKVYTGAAWVALGGTGTFTGGTISSDVALNTTVDILSSSTIAHTNSIGVRDVDAAGHVDVLRWTNANTPVLVLGNAVSTLSIASLGGLNVTTAGVVTGVTNLTATGIMSINTSGTAATNIGTGSYSGAITIGNNSASLAIATSSWDMSSAGALSGISDFTLTGDLLLANGKGVKSTVTTAQSVGVYGYDTDGSYYVGALVITNSATPATVLGNTDGTTAISSSDWTISTAGNAANLGTIGADGLITASGGLTLTGTVSISDSASTATTSIGGGTTTGTVSIATGASAQAINIGTGAAAKAVTLGSATTSSSVAINGGTSDITITSIDDVTINGGTSGSVLNLFTNNHDNVLNIGTGTAGNEINIGTNDTTLDDINVGTVKDTVSITGIDVTLVSGATGVLINNDTNQLVGIGTGTSTGTVTIGGAAAQSIAIGNGAAAKTVAVGSNNSTSATTILSGTGDLALSSTDKITITTATAVTDTIAVLSSISTEAAAISLTATSGGITTAAGTTYTATASGAVALFSNAVEQTITLGNETSASSLALKAGTGNITMDGVAATTITIGDAAQVGTIKLGESSAGLTLNLATGNGAKVVNVATGTGIDQIVLGGGGTAADNIDIADEDSQANTIDIGGTASTTTLTGTVTNTVGYIGSAVNVGAAEATCTAAEYSNNGYHRTVLTVVGGTIVLEDKDDGNGVLLYTFPQGNVVVMGCFADVVVTSEATITTAYAMAVGTTAGADASATLETTEADLVASTVITCGAGNEDFHGLSALTAAGQIGVPFDGTGGGKTVYLNAAVANANISAESDVVGVSGTIVLEWIYLGDF